MDRICNGWRSQTHTWLDPPSIYLFALYAGKTEIQAQGAADAFIGKWITISGRIWSVSAWSGHFCQVMLERSDLRAVHMWFRDKSWLDELSVLARGDQVTVRGRIDAVAGFVISLEDCELVEDDPQLATKDS